MHWVMRIGLLLGSLLLTGASAFILWRDGWSAEAFAGLALFGGSSLLFIFQKQLDNWQTKRIREWW